jgi:hypothetical protein
LEKDKQLCRQLEEQDFMEVQTPVEVSPLSKNNPGDRAAAAAKADWNVGQTIGFCRLPFV